jgi:hypothetical protein
LHEKHRCHIFAPTKRDKGKDCIQKRIILLVLQRLKIVRIIKKESLVLIEEVKD